MEIQTGAPIIMKFCTHIPTCPSKGLVQVCHPSPPPSGPGGSKTLKAEGHIFENCLQNKRCSAGCKLTRALPGTSASILMIEYFYS